MASYGPSNKTNLEPSTPTYAWLTFKFIMYTILLGVPLTYAHRLGKADWVQVRGSKCLFSESTFDI
jgi:hypothetical protein